MPLFRTKTSGDLKYLIWKIEESKEQLLEGLTLHDSDNERLKSINHPEKEKEFLAIRNCLREEFTTNPEVIYSKNGKPFLKDKEVHISFSHTSNYAAVLISNQNVGLDLEVYRERIDRIAPKFMRKEEFDSINRNTHIQHLLAYWGCKEVIIKVEDDKTLDFKSEINVEPFSYEPNKIIRATSLRNESLKTYNIHFEEVGPLFVSYGWEIKHK